MNTSEGNELIAKFRGLKLIHKNEFNLLGEQAYTGLNKNVKWGIYEYLNYHNDWRDLMNVIDEIESLDLGDVFLKDRYDETDPYYDASVSFIISHDCVLNLYGTMTIYENFIDHNSKSKIENVWLTVVEFIKWYNENHLNE